MEPDPPTPKFLFSGSADESPENRQKARNLLPFAAVILFITALVAGWTLCNQIPVPASLQNTLKPGSLHVASVILVDSPNVSKGYIDDLIRPAIMVMNKHFPGKPAHLRVIICGEGLPIGYSADGIAGGLFQPATDEFVFDVRVLERDLQKNSLPQSAYLAFVMGHEAYHRIQWMRGDLQGYGAKPLNLATYHQDPIEQAAFLEGSIVANAFLSKESQMPYRKWISSSNPAAPSSYADMVPASLNTIVSISVHETWTAKGAARRLIRLGGGLFF